MDNGWDVLLRKIFLPGLVAAFLIAGCTTNIAEVDFSAAENLAAKVCSSAESELRTANDLTQVLIKQCEVQKNDSGDIAFILALNDYLEWGVLETKSVEDIIYTIPLGLVTYAFAKSGVEPESFNRVLVVLNDSSKTVYDIKPKDLRAILVIENEAEAKQALKDLRTKMEVTSID